MKFLFEKWFGNDYHCSCCRQTWTVCEELEFPNKKLAIEHAREIDGNKDDSGVSAVYILKNEGSIY